MVVELLNTSSAEVATTIGTDTRVHHVSTYLTDGTHSVDRRLVTDYNGWVRSIATGEGAVLVDLYEGMLSDVTRYIGLDGLHPTEAGYERMAELVFAAIKNSFEVH